MSLLVIWLGRDAKLCGLICNVISRRRSNICYLSVSVFGISDVLLGQGIWARKLNILLLELIMS